MLRGRALEGTKYAFAMEICTVEHARDGLPDDQISEIQDGRLWLTHRYVYRISRRVHRPCPVL